MNEIPSELTVIHNFSSQESSALSYKLFINLTQHAAVENNFPVSFGMRRKLPSVRSRARAPFTSFLICSQRLTSPILKMFS